MLSADEKDFNIAYHCPDSVSSLVVLRRYTLEQHYRFLWLTEILLQWYVLLEPL